MLLFANGKLLQFACLCSNVDVATLAALVAAAQYQVSRETDNCQGENTADRYCNHCTV